MTITKIWINDDRILSQAFEPGYDPYNADCTYREEICLACAAEQSMSELLEQRLMERYRDSVFA